MLSLSDLIHDLSDSEDELESSASTLTGDVAVIEGTSSSRVPWQSPAERCESDEFEQGGQQDQQDWALPDDTGSTWHEEHEDHEEHGSYYEPASDGSNGGDGGGQHGDLLEHGHAELVGQHHHMESNPHEHEQLASVIGYVDAYAYADATAYGRSSLPMAPTPPTPPSPPSRSPPPRSPPRAEPEQGPPPLPLSATVTILEDAPLGHIEQFTHALSIQGNVVETLNADDSGRAGSIGSSTAPSTPRNRERSVTTENSTSSDAASPPPTATAGMTRSLSDLYDEFDRDDMALQVAETGKEVDSFAERMVAFVYNDTDGDGSATLAGVITPLKKRISGLFLSLSARKGDENAMTHPIDAHKLVANPDSETIADDPDTPTTVTPNVPSEADPSITALPHESRDCAESHAIWSLLESDKTADHLTTMMHSMEQEMDDAEGTVSVEVDETPEEDVQDIESDECDRRTGDLPALSTSSSPTAVITSWTEAMVDVRFGDSEYSDSANASDQEASPQEESIAIPDNTQSAHVELDQSSEPPISVREEERLQERSTPDDDVTARPDPPSSSPTPAPQHETRSTPELLVDAEMMDQPNDSEPEVNVAQELAAVNPWDGVEPPPETAPELKKCDQAEHRQEAIMHTTIIDEFLSEAVETMRIARETRSQEPRMDMSEDLPVVDEADGTEDEEQEVVDDEHTRSLTHSSPRDTNERPEMRSADLYSVPSSPLARFTSEASDDSPQRDEASDNGTQRNKASDDGELRDDLHTAPREATPVEIAPPVTSSPGMESPTPLHAPRLKPKPEPTSQPTPRSASIPAQSFYVDVPALPRRRQSSMSDHAGSSHSNRQAETRRSPGPVDNRMESPTTSVPRSEEMLLLDTPLDLDEPRSRELSVQSRSSSTRQAREDSLEESLPGPVPMEVVQQPSDAPEDADLAVDTALSAPPDEQDDESDHIVEPVSPPRRKPRRIIVEEEISPSPPTPSLPPLTSSIALSDPIRPFESLSKSPPPVEHDRAPPSPGPSTRQQKGDSSSDGETLIMIPRARQKKKRKNASPVVKKKLPRPKPPIEPVRELSDESSADELDMLSTPKVRLSPAIGRKITLQSRPLLTTTAAPYIQKTVKKVRHDNPSNRRLSLPSRSVPALDRSNAKGYIIASDRPRASMDNTPSSSGRPTRTRKSTANWWELSKGLQRNEPFKTKRQRKEENEDEHDSRGFHEESDDERTLRTSVSRKKTPSSLSKRRRVSRVVADDEDD